MPRDCPACGAELRPAGRGDEFHCDRCGARLRAPREASDGDDRPRPRRRPPPRRGNRVLAVLVAIGFVLLLGCGGLVAVVFVAGGPNWRQHSSPAGKYTVDLPADPRPDMAQIAAKHGPLQPGVTYEGTILVGRLEEYSVVYTDIAPDVRFANTDQKLLDLATEGFKSAHPPAQVRATKDLKVSGYPAREMEMEVGGQHLLARVVVARNRLYTVIGGGPFAAAGEPRVRRFVESFKLNDPRPAGDDAPIDDDKPPPRR